MARKDLLESTIKQLFALSGNYCAFPNCRQKMVEGSMVIGEICHIEAAEERGQRYNADQTDDERRSFENLILLCPTHHKITDDVNKFPVQALRKMKAEHETRFADAPFLVSDQMVQDAINSYNIIQTNLNTGSGYQNITHSGNIVHYGLDLKDAIDLFETLFKQNFPRLQEYAQNEAKLRVEKLERSFLDRANSRLTSEDLNAFADPDVQFILNRAIETVARKDSKELRDNLSRLLVERIRNNDDDLLAIIVDEAITTIGRLTRNQLMIICAQFMFVDYMTRQNIDSWESLNNYFNTYIKPFLDFQYNYADIQHIAYTGCGSINHSPFFSDLDYHFEQHFPSLFYLPIDVDQIQKLHLPQDLIERIFIPVSDTMWIFALDREYKIQPLINNYMGNDYKTYHERMEIINAVDELHKKYVLKPDEEIENSTSRAKILEEIDIADKAISVWKEAGLYLLHLNSVGLVIAAVYCSQILGKDIDLESLFWKYD